MLRDERLQQVLEECETEIFDDKNPVFYDFTDDFPTDPALVVITTAHGKHVVRFFEQTYLATATRHPLTQSETTSTAIYICTDENVLSIFNNLKEVYEKIKSLDLDSSDFENLLAKLKLELFSYLSDFSRMVEASENAIRVLFLPMDEATALRGEAEKINREIAAMVSGLPFPVTEAAIGKMNPDTLKRIDDLKKTYQQLTKAHKVQQRKEAIKEQLRIITCPVTHTIPLHPVFVLEPLDGSHIRDYKEVGKSVPTTNPVLESVELDIIQVIRNLYDSIDENNIEDRLSLIIFHLNEYQKLQNKWIKDHHDTLQRVGFITKWEEVNLNLPATSPVALCLRRGWLYRAGDAFALPVEVPLHASLSLLQETISKALAENIKPEEIEAAIKAYENLKNQLEAEKLKLIEANQAFFRCTYRTQIEALIKTETSQFHLQHLLSINARLLDETCPLQVILEQTEEIKVAIKAYKKNAHAHAVAIEYLNELRGICPPQEELLNEVIERLEMHMTTNPDKIIATYEIGRKLLLLLNEIRTLTSLRNSYVAKNWVDEKHEWGRSANQLLKIYDTFYECYRGVNAPPEDLLDGVRAEFLKIQLRQQCFPASFWRKEKSARFFSSHIPRSINLLRAATDAPATYKNEAELRHAVEKAQVLAKKQAGRFILPGTSQLEIILNASWEELKMIDLTSETAELKAGKPARK